MLKCIYKGKEGAFMIDLHVHTNNSDGSDSTEELLKKHRV